MLVLFRFESSPSPLCTRYANGMSLASTWLTCRWLTSSTLPLFLFGSTISFITITGSTVRRAASYLASSSILISMSASRSCAAYHWTGTWLWHTLCALWKFDESKQVCMQHKLDPCEGKNLKTCCTKKTWTSLHVFCEFFILSPIKSSSHSPLDHFQLFLDHSKDASLMCLWQLICPHDPNWLYACIYECEWLSAFLSALR